MIVKLACYRLTAFVLASLLLAASGCGEKPSQADIVISDAVMPVPAPGQATAAVYLALSNNGTDTLVINHISAPVAEHIEVHRNLYEDGMMKMRPVNHLMINPGSRLLFTPGGYHLMVFGMANPLKSGDSFPITIEFEGGKSVTAAVAVKPLSL